ncbi:MAG: hypothetical protein ABI658_13300 [Acidimicrobiales bacterium]
MSLARYVGWRPSGLHAPRAAVTFTMEEIVGHLDQTILAGVVVAAAVAAAIEPSVLGGHPVFDVAPGYGWLAFSSGLASARRRVFTRR